MERVDEALAILGKSTKYICMLVTEVLPCDVITQQFPPVSRYLRCSCEGLRVVDKGEYLDTRRAKSALVNMPTLTNSLTLKHNSFGNTINGSFLNRGLTKLETKLSCWLSQRPKMPIKNFCFFAFGREEKCMRALTRNASSSSSADDCQFRGR